MSLRRDATDPTVSDDFSTSINLFCFLCLLLLNIVVKCLMIWRGHDAKDVCPNKAADWLFVGGIILLVAIVITGCAQLTRLAAVSKNQHTPQLLTATSATVILMQILELGIIIWGSVVVFGHWEDYCDKYCDDENYRRYNTKEGKEEFLNDDDFCEWGAMLFAFVILIVHWVFVALILLLTSFYVCCMAAFGKRYG